MQSLVQEMRNRGEIDWQALMPKCTRNECPGRRGRWLGLWRRHDGAYIEDQWYCGPECIQAAIEQRLGTLFASPCPVSFPTRHRMPLGLVLLSRGIIDREALVRALDEHRTGELRIGECLVGMGLVSEDEVTSALAAQWACPVYPSDKVPDAMELVPRGLQHFHRMLPMHWVNSTRELYFAFATRIDYTALYAIEKMLHCRTHACLISESVLNRWLNTCKEVPSEREVVFSSPTGAHEAARIVLGYAQQIGAERMHIQECGAHVWLRVKAEGAPMDLIFRRWVE